MELLWNDRVAGVLAVAALAISVVAVVANYNATRRAGRLEFGVWLVAISLVAAVFLSGDLAMLFGTGKASLPLSVLYLSWGILAWPFYQRLCRRIFDANLPRYVALVGLVPYVNYLLFLIMCFVPSRR